jgi:hypothetical protein
VVLSSIELVVKEDNFKPTTGSETASSVLDVQSFRTAGCDKVRERLAVSIN